MYRQGLRAWLVRKVVFAGTVCIVLAMGKLKGYSAAVAITSPLNNSSVSGNVTVTMKLGPNVWWTWMYIDGKPGPSGYNPLIWNSSGQSTGTHTLSVRAFPKNSSQRLGTSTVSVTLNGSQGGPTTYYVDSRYGSDGNSGLSSTSPWQTLKAANTALPNLHPGDSILFAQGSYFTASSATPMINLSYPLDGSSGSPITLGTYGSGPLPVFDGNHIATACIDACSVNGEGCAPTSAGVPLWSYITINGFECKNTTAIGIGFKQDPGSLAPVPMPGIVIENNYVHDTGAYPDDGSYNNQIEFLEYTYMADGVQILNNTIEHPGGHNGLQVHGDSGNPLVKGNTCVGPWGHNCIDLKETVGAIVDSNISYEPASSGSVAGSAFNYMATQVSPSDVTFTRNVSYGPMTGSALSCGGGQPFNGPTCTPGHCSVTCKIYNNTLNTTAGAAFSTDVACAAPGENQNTLDIENNVLDAVRAIWVGGACGSNTSILWDYNDDCATQSGNGISCYLWPNGGSYLTLQSLQSATGQGTHDLFFVNPEYVDLVAGNLSLLATSPLIGIGLVNLVPGLTDIGAY